MSPSPSAPLPWRARPVTTVTTTAPTAVARIQNGPCDSSATGLPAGIETVLMATPLLPDFGRASEPIVSTTVAAGPRKGFDDRPAHLRGGQASGRPARPQ